MTTPEIPGEQEQMDREIVAALSRRPAVPVPAGFAARVARQAGMANVRKSHRALPWGWGQLATALSLVLLLALLLRSGAAPGPSLLLNQVTLTAEFLLLLLGGSYLRRAFF